MKRLLIITISIIASLRSEAQTTCNNALFEANKLYETGQLQEAIDLLEPCYLGQNIDKEARLDAARLLALCYLFNQDEVMSDGYVRDMIEIQPEYQKYPNIDPQSLKAIIDKYSVESALSIGFTAGVSSNHVRVIKSYSPSNTPSAYSSNIGLTAGIECEYKLGKLSSLRATPSLNLYSYKRELNNVAGNKKVYLENMTSLGLPLVYRKYFTLKNWNVHTELGIQYNYLVSSFADMQSTKLLDGTMTQSSTKTTPYRNRNLYGGTVGIGATTTLGKGRVGINLSLVSFIPNIAVPDARYDNVDFILDAQYIDSDFSLNSVAINFSYQLPLTYRIRKSKS